jgi:hypothetical protein
VRDARRTRADDRARRTVPDRAVELAARRATARAGYTTAACAAAAGAAAGVDDVLGAVAAAAGAEPLGEPPLLAGCETSCFFGALDGELDGLPRSVFPRELDPDDPDDPDGFDDAVVLAGSATSCAARTCSGAGTAAAGAVELTAFRSCPGGTRSACAMPAPGWSLSLGSAATTGDPTASPQAATHSAIANRARSALLRKYVLVGLAGDCDITTS